ncbi:hypothetical protein AB1I62_08920 [Enterococcus sp. AN402]|uniref:hypothetical protein n=1 Tax=Enterococcus sp. AN402 TaxID=3151386 RepID=UPI0034597551
MKPQKNRKRGPKKFNDNKFVKGLKKQENEQLTKRHLKIDGCFEGDFTTWMGCYAIQEDKPTALDPMNEEVAKEQDEYRANGMVQDFSEWYKRDIVSGTLENFI